MAGQPGGSAVAAARAPRPADTVGEQPAGHWPGQVRRGGVSVGEWRVLADAGNYRSVLATSATTPTAASHVTQARHGDVAARQPATGPATSAAGGSTSSRHTLADAGNHRTFLATTTATATTPTSTSRATQARHGDLAARQPATHLADPPTRTAASSRSRPAARQPTGGRRVHGNSTTHAERSSYPASRPAAKVRTLPPTFADQEDR